MHEQKKDQNPFLELDRFANNIALFSNDESHDYRSVLSDSDQFALQLGHGRHLIFLEARNDYTGVTALLGCLRAGHIIFLFAEGDEDKLPSLINTYEPNWIITRSARGGLNLDRRHDRQLELNKDLCVLLSTSGSTGSPKFVKLSYKNLAANANSIAEYLEITQSDRAATTLKYNYSYGLSVITSHFLHGASLALTEESVSTPGFWRWFNGSGATSFAGVPYIFEILDRNEDFATQSNLRYVTQAGGRLNPDLVKRMVALGREHGWKFFVMYGQTEAAPRMAYLPPDLAETHPDCIGIAIPGGELGLVDETGHALTDIETPGELIYRGENVMLGYAQSPEDLATNATPPHLATGDIAVINRDGLFRIVGRASRFIKPYGVRLSLDDVQAHLQSHAPGAWATGTDEQLIVALDIDANPDTSALKQCLAQTYSLPLFAISILPPQLLPRLANGKPDYQNLTRQAAASVTANVDATRNGADRERWRSISEIFKDFIGSSRVERDSSFLTLAADSLSYVVISLAIEEYLGHLPNDWETLSVETLEGLKGKSQTSSTAPQHFLHFARVLLLLIGIPFHASMWFVTVPISIISAPRHSIVANLIYSAIHSFRMFAFYFISGYFGALILRRLPISTWFGQQAKRTCLPMLAGAIMLTPLEMAAIAIAPGRSGIAPFAFWLHSMTAPGEYWLSTRWFLATLLGIAILMALATCLYRLSPVAASMKRAFTWMEEHPAACWTGYLASVGLACFALAASSRILQDNVLLLGCFEWRSIIYYAPAYALGAVMWARPKLFNWFLEPSRFDWILALVAFGVLIFTDLGPSGIWLIINKLTWVPFGLLISRVFLSAMHRYANAPRPWVARLIDASFVIYIWHIVFVLALNDIWFKLAIWPGLAIILSSIGAFAASWAMYLVVRQSTLLSLAFNGGPLRPSGASPMRRDRARS